MESRDLWKALIGVKAKCFTTEVTGFHRVSCEAGMVHELREIGLKLIEF